ncbi:MAG: hypothetical protein ABJP45_05815 [Cyclobacteriaceae bacterium]
MKKILYISLSLSVFLMSCSSDDSPTPTHEIGTWSLDGYQFINFETGFESNNELSLGINQLSFGGAAFEDYFLTLNIDETYTREIGVAGPDIDDSGTWELNEDELILDSEEVGEDIWQVERNEDDDFWISFPSQNSFIPDIYFDTVTQEYRDYLETLTDAELDSVNAAIARTATFDLVFIFERD